MNYLMTCALALFICVAVGCGEKAPEAQTGRMSVMNPDGSTSSGNRANTAGQNGAPAEQQQARAGEAEQDTAVAMFGAGCFWGVEAAFRQLEGVTATAVGYAGGHVENPTYEQVCRKGTGHAEVVRVEYDPGQLGYEDLLDVFWNKHDPTQLNRQGPDIGDQYRSVIFYYGDEQKQLAESTRQALDASGKYRKPVVTQIEPAPTFYMAEDYHQQYLEKRGLSTCASGLSGG
jgi:peptide-methionine (S)-S-oxide reductase